MKHFVVALFCLTTAFCSQPGLAETPAAYVYVQTSTGVRVYDASPAGKLTLVPGSPAKTSGLMIGSNGKHFITLGTVFLHSYVVASNGAVGEQESEISTQDYCSQCPAGATAGAVLAHTGQDVYVSLQSGGSYNDENQYNAYLSFNIGKSSGALTFLDEVNFDQDGRYGPGSDTLPTISQNDAFLYSTDCCLPDSGESMFNIFSRQSNGALELASGNDVGSYPEAPPSTDGGELFYNPYLAKADPTNHLAVLMYLTSNSGGAPTPISQSPQLASFTIGKNGAISSTNTWQNMPTVASGNCYGFGCGASLMNMSPSGKVLAVATGTGVQFFHFNGAAPITQFTGVLGSSGYVSSLGWDNASHLYAVNAVSKALHVYTVSNNSVVEAPGSPYAIGASGVVVVPR